MTWTFDQLDNLLQQQESLSVSNENGVLFLTNEDGIDACITISGEQIIVESLLCATKQIKDSSTFNDVILRTHMQMFPLTTLGITEVDGDSYYTAFGTLSSKSKEDSILVEIDLLFQNVEGMLESYEDHIV